MDQQYLVTKRSSELNTFMAQNFLGLNFFQIHKIFGTYNFSCSIIFWGLNYRKFSSFMIRLVDPHQNWSHQNWRYQNWSHQNWSYQNWSHQNRSHQNRSHQNWSHQNWSHQNWSHQHWCLQNCLHQIYIKFKLYLHQI